MSCPVLREQKGHFIDPTFGNDTVAAVKTNSEEAFPKFPPTISTKDQDVQMRIIRLCHTLVQVSALGSTVTPQSASAGTKEGGKEGEKKKRDV